MNIKMERPNLNEESNDLLDQVEYLIELEKYCDFIETENKRLKLCEVGINEVALVELQEQYNQKCLQKRYLEKDLDEANKILIDNGLKQNPIQSNISRKA